MSRMIIDSFSGENHFLSNFHPSKVIMDGVEYSTVEHAYQAAKTLDPEERTVICGSPTPGMAKKLGKHAKIRPDWEDIKLEVMTELVYQKFTKHRRLGDKLLATRDAELIEGNTWGDRYWGVCNGNGQNNLGKILMAVRRSLEETNEHSTT